MTQPKPTKTLVILNDGPYGTERSYNGLRLACSLAKRSGEEVDVFLIGDAAACAKSGQKVPQGYYNLELMLRSVTRRGGKVGVCGTCMDARGITEVELAEGCRRSTMEELTDWTQQANRVLVF
ncbi:MAG TPA: DsrE family protein [Acidimicrobiia bacterium]|nr:DsrE family protein [Acidimicrobiia bacterium]